jgi:hypothetical protein
MSDNFVAWKLLHESVRLAFFSTPSYPCFRHFQCFVRQTSMSRGRSFKQRLKRFWQTLIRPFALSARHPASTSMDPTSSAYPMSSRSVPPNRLHNGTIPAHPRDGSLPLQTTNGTERIRANLHRHPDPTYRSTALRAEYQNSQSDPIALPFRLSVDQFHDKTHRESTLLPS